ncbi:MAG: carbon-nitrogen hydrolase family protein [Bacteroidetes bacterium]|nr:carbon-nitrogen hydrolase family protein [Bacteroidota bacterium]
MNNAKKTSRRNFIKNSSLGLSVGVAGVSLPTFGTTGINETKRSARQICVASVDLWELWPDATRESRIKRVLERMQNLVDIQPDLVCLPEMFDTSWVDEEIPINEMAEDEKNPGPVTGSIAAFARKNKCYVVCPLVTKKKGNFYNSSVLLDREGKIAGVYHKIHPTASEIIPNDGFKGGGVIPGAIDQPVIETDFGKVGMQICFDANWDDGWDNFKKKGADIVLFSSQFPGGRMLNYHALKNNYYIVSSTGEDARIIDKSGNDITATTEFVRYVWATINLEKVNVAVWPANERIPDLFKKYGNRIQVRAWSTSDIITIESLDPQLKVLDVLKEFNIRAQTDELKYETEVQNKYRSDISIK